MKHSHLVSIALSAAFLACSETEISFECPSPSRSSVATFYSLSGGGAAGWLYFRVSVRDAELRLDPTKYVFQMRHGYDAQLVWSSDTELLIAYPHGASMDSREPRSGSIEIRYEELPSRDGTFRDEIVQGCGSAG